MMEVTILFYHMEDIMENEKRVSKLGLFSFVLISLAIFGIIVSAPASSSAKTTMLEKLESESHPTFFSKTKTVLKYFNQPVYESGLFSNDRKEFVNDDLLRNRYVEIMGWYKKQSDWSTGKEKEYYEDNISRIDLHPKLLDQFADNNKKIAYAKTYLPAETFSNYNLTKTHAYQKNSNSHVGVTIFDYDIKPDIKNPNKVWIDTNIPSSFNVVVRQKSDNNIKSISILERLPRWMSSMEMNGYSSVTPNISF